MITANGLSFLGLIATLIILYANLRTWWTGSRNLKSIAPFASGFCFGGAATACTGGLLGFLAGCTVGAANTGGEKGVPKLTGAQGNGALARGDLGTLTLEGGGIVALATVALIISWRAAGKDVKKRMVGGVWCGTTLCVTAGVAGLMQWLIPSINQAGATVRALVESGL